MEEKGKRCFIAVDLSDDIKRQIKKIQGRLPEFRGKETEQENLHLTLKFLGEISDKNVELAREVLRGLVFKKFKIKINKIDVFSRKFIRIVWVGVEEVGEGRTLWRLQQDVDRKLKDLFERERRFMGHITIARVKKVEDKRGFLEGLEKIKVDLEQEVSEFKLKESKLSSEGPKYSDIEVYALE